MIKVNTIEEGVKKLLSEDCITVNGEWSYRVAKKDDLTDYLVYNNAQIPLFFWRYDQRYVQMYSRLNGIIGEVCSLKTSNYGDRETGLNNLLYSEIDLSQWFLSSKIQYLTAFINQQTLNCIFMMENGMVSTLELAATLASETENQCKHTVYGTGGMVSDRVVANKITPSSIYLFADEPNPIRYNEDSIRLYGLNKTEIEKAWCIYSILAGHTDYSDWCVNDYIIKEIIRLCYKSSQEERRIYVESKGGII